jgi:hypothetical protein
MARLVEDLVKVEFRDGIIPSAFLWRGKRYTVLEVLAWWREPAAWWDGGRVRRYFRLRAYHRRGLPKSFVGTRVSPAATTTTSGLRSRTAATVSSSTGCLPEAAIKSASPLLEKEAQGR